MQASRNIYFPVAWSIYLVSFLIILIQSSCTPGYVSEAELRAYVLEKGELTKTREYKGFKTQVTYRPTDLLIAQELGGEAARTQEELNRLGHKYGGYYYFILSLSRGEQEALYGSMGGYGQFSELVQTLSFRMAEYLTITTTGGDTIEVADYIFPRTYGMGGATNLMFVFNKKDAQDDEWVQLNLKEFGLGLGHQTFRFRRRDLEGVPRIKFAVGSPDNDR